jgi:ParB family chromosome partitioning protein
MSRQHHYLKTETEYFQAIEKGDKTFEFRKNDRDFKLYDVVHLEESVNGVKTGRVLGHLEIKYILYGGKFGLPEGYCVFCWKDDIPY